MTRRTSCPSPRRVGEPFRTTASGGTVVFEIEDGGTLMGKEFTNRVVFSMDVRDGRVSSFREYVGDVDPDLFGGGHARNGANGGGKKDESAGAPVARTKLSSDNCALVMVDHLTGFLSGVRTIDPATYIHNVTAVAKLSGIFGLPTFVLGDEGGFRGRFMVPIENHLRGRPRFSRHTPSG